MSGSNEDSGIALRQWCIEKASAAACAHTEIVPLAREIHSFLTSGPRAAIKNPDMVRAVQSTVDGAEEVSDVIGFLGEWKEPLPGIAEKIRHAHENGLIKGRVWDDTSGSYKEATTKQIEADILKNDQPQEQTIEPITGGVQLKMLNVLCAMHDAGLTDVRPIHIRNRLGMESGYMTYPLETLEKKKYLRKVKKGAHHTVLIPLRRADGTPYVRGPEQVDASQATITKGDPGAALGYALKDEKPDECNVLPSGRARAQAAPLKQGERRCMSCDKPFASEGIFNRLCGVCRRKGD